MAIEALSEISKGGQYAFGSPLATALDATTDFDIITDPGWYPKLLGAAPGSRNANFPTGQTGAVNYVWLHVAKYGTNCHQTAYSYASSNLPAQVWHRTLGGGVWSSWAGVWTTDSLVKTTSATDTTAERTLKNGDHGIGTTAPAVDENLNNIANTGFTTVVGTEADAAANNWPLTGLASGTFVHYNVHTILNQPLNRISQIAIECLATVPGSRMWLRTKHDATWTSWVEFWTSGNLSVGTTAHGSPAIGDLWVDTN